MERNKWIIKGVRDELTHLWDRVQCWASLWESVVQNLGIGLFLLFSFSVRVLL